MLPRIYLLNGREIDSKDWLGGCENDESLRYAEVWMCTGHNWRLNHRWSKTLRYCKGFKPRRRKIKNEM